MPIAFNPPISSAQPKRAGTNGECANRIRDIDPFGYPASSTHTEHIHPLACAVSFRLESACRSACKRRPLVRTSTLPSRQNRSELTRLEEERH